MHLPPVPCTDVAPEMASQVGYRAAGLGFPRGGGHAHRQRPNQPRCGALAQKVPDSARTLQETQALA